jgi:hypothetical protein
MFRNEHLSGIIAILCVNNSIWIKFVLVLLPISCFCLLPAYTAAVKCKLNAGIILNLFFFNILLAFRPLKSRNQEKCNFKIFRDIK